MKANVIALIILLMVGCNSKTEESSLQGKQLATANIKVWGNCEMCQETIEGSLKTSGVSSASWDTETKILTVSYDSTQVKLDQIHRLVSASGYDTEKYKADEESYKNLHECCQYERRP